MKCCRCQKDNAINVMLPVAKQTESSKLIFPNETKDTSVQMSFPLCFYCMSLAGEGFIIPIEEDGRFCFCELSDKDSGYSIRFFEERYKIGELSKDIDESLGKLNMTRKQVKKQKLKRSPLRIAIIIEELKKLTEEDSKEEGKC